MVHRRPAELAAQVLTARESLGVCLDALTDAVTTGAICAWLAGPEYALPHRARKWRMADLPPNVAADLGQVLDDLDRRLASLEVGPEPVSA